LMRIMHQNNGGKSNELAREGYWLFHKSTVEMSQMYANPEEKLWFVVGKQLNNETGMKHGGGGIKLEKNSIIRLGRIRLRVRDIDYPEAEPAVIKEVVPKPESPVLRKNLDS
jgi:hypothetical protein